MRLPRGPRTGVRLIAMTTTSRDAASLGGGRVGRGSSLDLRNFLQSALYTWMYYQIQKVLQQILPPPLHLPRHASQRARQPVADAEAVATTSRSGDLLESSPAI